MYTYNLHLQLIISQKQSVQNRMQSTEMVSVGVISRLVVDHPVLIVINE